jgi:hypothetical protein
LVRSSVVRGIVIMVANNLRVTALTTVPNIVLDRNCYYNSFRKKSNRFRFEDPAFTLLGERREHTMVEENKTRHRTSRVPQTATKENTSVIRLPTERLGVERTGESAVCRKA